MPSLAAPRMADIVDPFFALDRMRKIAIDVVIVKARITMAEPMDASVTCSSNDSGGRPGQIQSLSDLFSLKKISGMP